MKIKVLMENESSSENYESEHGLSFYIEFNNKKILFDVGATDKFIKNAEKMKIELKDVEYLILSHGHNDHGGGLKYFLELNNKVKIYCSKNYFGEFFKKEKEKFKYIGVEKVSREIKFIDYLEKLDEIILFSLENYSEENPINMSLYKKEKNKIVIDDFKHELNLIIGNVLIVGCAHNGIDKILEKANELVKIDYIIGGFHLSSRSIKKSIDNYIEKVIENLNKYDLKGIYPCHCTGERGLELLHKKGKFKVKRLKSGDELLIF